MTLPSPPHPLQNHCSAVWNNTLYVYSPAAFQSLALDAGAVWNEEVMGVSLTGATCSQGWVEGDSSRPALFVVGGSANSSSTQYSGLQRYSFLDRRWDTIVPVVTVTANRQHHGSTFLNASSSLMVYAGSQDDGDTAPSTQTFVISTVAPYNVQAFNSIAPPVTDPIVLAWNDSSAVMVGGGTSNLKVFTFNPDGGWEDLGVSLTNAIPDHSSASCALLTLDDHSKILETFDMATSPNTVTRTVLVSADGSPASTGQTIGNPSSTKAKRDLTLNDFPPYNATLAPHETRQNFSLTQGTDGLVVISGGNDNDPLCIFNQAENSWVNATRLLARTQTTITLGGSGSSASPSVSSASVTSSPTSATTSSSKSSGTNHGLIILGGVLGGIFGVAALCIIALLILRYLKKKKQGERKRRQSDFPQDQKVRRRSTSFSFHEQDVEPFSKAGMPMGRGPVPSTDSAAFFKEIGGNPRGPISRPIPLQTQSSDTVKKSLTSSGIAEASSGEIDPSLNQQGKRKTDEGWSQYFQGNNAINLADGRSTYASAVTESDYRGSTWPDFTAPRSPSDPRLHSGIGTQIRKGNVAMGSPNLEHPSSDGRGTGLALSEGTQGKISSTDSLSTTMSEDDLPDEIHDDVDYNGMGDAYSSGIPASVKDDSHWDTVGGYHEPHRPPSSNYTKSYYPASSTYGDQRDTQLSAYPLPLTARQTRWPIDEMPPPPAPPTETDIQKQKPTRPPRPSQASEQMRDYFGANAERRRSSDMSWLNLGTNR